MEKQGEGARHLNCRISHPVLRPRALHDRRQYEPRSLPTPCHNSYQENEHWKLVDNFFLIKHYLLQYLTDT